MGAFVIRLNCQDRWGNISIGFNKKICLKEEKMIQREGL